MSNYAVLTNILDVLRGEAEGSKHEEQYLPANPDIEALNQARARAFIHLYLKVSFGLLTFSERNHYFTDGSYDGGVDAYFIDREKRIIYFVQAKFRTTQANFENKPISLEEILVMDLPRILSGESTDAAGNRYNGKIQQLQREVSEIHDIGRYSYKVILLANLGNWPQTKLQQMSGGVPVEVFDYTRSYRDLVFPVISGTFFNASDLQIALDLSNKNAGSKISYEVATRHNDCEITVLFVPTIEIAKVMHRYKNSILKFNPRSYLELEGHKVNEAITNTIQQSNTNEFALFNNGITILSDETYINERIGQRNKAQLTLKNPQIINGGQTAYTLSRIYEEHIGSSLEAVFEGKEVLLKVITVMDLPGKPATPEQKLDIIDRISTATNQQTPVINADKNSNNSDHAKIQSILFDRYGILYEKKRGEFADGIHKGYITPELIIERNLYFRLYFAVLGESQRATEKKLFTKIEDPIQTIVDTSVLDRLYLAFLCLKIVTAGARLVNRVTRDQLLYAKLYAMSLHPPANLQDYAVTAESAVAESQKRWSQLINTVKREREEFRHDFIDKLSLAPKSSFRVSAWLNSPVFEEDVLAWY